MRKARASKASKLIYINTLRVECNFYVNFIFELLNLLVSKNESLINSFVELG